MKTWQKVVLTIGAAAAATAALIAGKKYADNYDYGEGEKTAKEKAVILKNDAKAKVAAQGCKLADKAKGTAALAGTKVGEIAYKAGEKAEEAGQKAGEKAEVAGIKLADRARAAGSRLSAQADEAAGEIEEIVDSIESK